MAVLPWPIGVLIPARITRHIAPRTTSGTVAASGFTQRVSAPAHAWVIEYDGIPVATAAALREWDRMEGALDGGANPVLVYLPGDQREVDGTVALDASRGDTRITIFRTLEIFPGFHFTLGARLYRVIEIMAAVGVGDGGNYDIKIRPPLRNDATVDDVALFSDLSCQCRLVSDDEMTLQIDSARIGFGKVRFVEDPS